MLEKVSHIILLKDFYGPLLTDKQQEVLNFHYEQDLSFAEIGAEMGISRQAVYDLVKRAERLLENYEHKLGLAARFSRYKQDLKRLQAMLNQENMNTHELNVLQQQLRQLSEILL